MYPALAPQPNGEIAKTLGAFYTDIQIADFLVWWAIRTAQCNVLDPSFGGGVFIRSACNRLLTLGGEPKTQVFGVEFDRQVHGTISEKLCDEFAIDPRNLRQDDFFDIDCSPVQKFTAVVGNPPFIRYHRFTSEIRNKALALAAEQGVTLSQLSSSWAPFLIHSASMLKRAGRLAMVLPMEVAHASYAIPVLRYLQNSFGHVLFLTFQKKLFPALSEDTLLLLADDYKGTFRGFTHRDVAHAGLLSDMQGSATYRIGGTQKLKASCVSHGSERLIEYLIPRKTRELYQSLKSDVSIQKLGELADVGIGYVTGANTFFHLSPDDVQEYGIPEEFLKPAVKRGRALSGLRFTKSDWKRALDLDYAGYLLHIGQDDPLPKSLVNYLEEGKRAGIHTAYKCRVRKPWYSVPHVYKPNAFLTYMSGSSPRLVANEAGVVAPNTLHILRTLRSTRLSANSIAALWQTSLTRLSAEVEGHAMGGGMLKVEPTEAERCLVAGGNIRESELKSIASELDALIRSEKESIAQSRADERILREHMGLSVADCARLREGAEILKNRRCARSSDR